MYVLTPGCCAFSVWRLVLEVPASLGPFSKRHRGLLCAPHTLTTSVILFAVCPPSVGKKQSSRGPTKPQMCAAVQKTTNGQTKCLRSGALLVLVVVLVCVYPPPPLVKLPLCSFRLSRVLLMSGLDCAVVSSGSIFRVVQS